jgi:iron complex outermembrane recepter protein
MTHNKLFLLISLATLAISARAQSGSPPGSRPPEVIQVTGSRLDRSGLEGSLPLTVFAKAELEASGITTAEQLLLQLNVAGNGSDNLASNTGIVSEEQRGNNGVSGANLRGQGADATLVLLNGRRVASHGLKGRAVDLNSIPFAALERVEVLRDGASAVYGTDAIGGVINFITRRNFQGAQLSAFSDQTEAGGGDIHQFSLLAGTGDLASAGYNLFATLSYRKNQALFGSERDFTSTFQPARGLSPDTRGPAFANVFSVSNQRNLIGNGLRDPAGNGNMTAISILDLPGSTGCDALPLMGPYDHQLWGQSASRYACAWDYPRAQALLQAQDSLDLVSRASFRPASGHEAFLEVVASEVDSKKSFEPYQVSPGATFGPSAWYPATGTAYPQIYQALAGYFGAGQLSAGAPIAYRWRCMDCGNREIATTTRSWRALAGFEGLLGAATYNAGLSRAVSQADSELGTGYYYTSDLVALLGTGTLNPFLLPGATQDAAALQGLEAASASGVRLFGGRTSLTQLDASLSTELEPLLGLDGIQFAAGLDLRREQFRFEGDGRSDPRPIYLAPFDDTNILEDVSRDIKAVYTEVYLPLTEDLDLTLAARYDHYSGFGGTTNPKLSFSYRPTAAWQLRGSYSRGFKVPAFNQLFNGVTELPYTGLDLADPFTCPGAQATEAVPGCAAIQPVQLFGGNATLNPEESSQYSAGLVYTRDASLFLSMDWWQIERTNTIRAAAQEVLVTNPELFRANWLRDGSGRIVAMDRRYINSGGSLSSGVDLEFRLDGSLAGGSWSLLLNGSYLHSFRTRGLDSLPWSDNLVGDYLRFFSLPLHWKHSLSVNYSHGNWSHTLTQLHRAAYRDEEPVSVANGSFTPAEWNPQVGQYRVYHYTLGYSGLDQLRLGFSIKNLLDEDPPFTAHQNDFSAGAAWEPRIADPRGRSFLLLAEYTF